MGEYAKYQGKEIKIGTCEDMYYLRYDQRHDVVPMRGSLTPSAPNILKVIRFRFPWPDEDGTAPGAFDDYNRGVIIPRAAPPHGLEHYTIQWSHPAGYVMFTPCPEGTVIAGVHRNGHIGSVRLVQQAMRGGWLAPVFACATCGAKWSEPDPVAARSMFANMLTWPGKMSEIARRAVDHAPAMAMQS